ncbi:MAG: trimethylamine methyltransferase family protein, partial [Anaerolineales bacterium]
MSSRRRRRRESPRERRKARAAKISKMSQPVHNIPIYEILNEEGAELIHEKSMEILKEVGVDFYLDEAQQILKDHGVKMEGDTAFFEPGLIDEYVSKAPSQFTQLARNPDNNLLIGSNRMVYAPVYGPPYVQDLERGRREATLE